MLDIGIQELLILMVLALLVFGPDKLPDLGRRLGRAMREFRRASDEFRSTIETNLNLTEEVPLPPSAATRVTPEPMVTTPADPPSPTVPTGGETAGAPAAEGSGEAAASPIDPVEPFCAQRGGRLLHRTGCGWAGRITEADRIVLKTASEGTEIGLVPCPVCDPAGGESPA